MAERSYQIVRNPVGFLQATPTPSVEELRSFYESQYFQKLPTAGYQQSYSDEELTWIRNKARVCRVVVEKHTRGRRLLDIGCGEGHLSSEFQQAGWTVTSWDFSRFALEKFHPELLPSFRAGDVYDLVHEHTARPGPTAFDAVNLTNVLEHVVDPLRLLQDLRPVLAPGGVVSVTVPNDFSRFQQLLVARGLTHESWVAPPQHLNYFDTTSLPQTLAHCGYHVQQQIADFPIEQFLANPHSNYWRDRSLGKGAHAARVLIENFLCSVDVDAYVRYMTAGAALGWGRDITAFAKVAP